MLKKSKIIILAVIFLLAFALRFYKLDSIPNGYREDETSIGYNAYSVLKTGMDEHGNKYPQNFKAFGEYKLPGYVYATVPSVAIFGLNPFGVRFISAISGFLIVIVSFFLSKEILKNQKHLSEWGPIAISLLLAVNPWLIFFSRSAFEVTLANLFIISGILLFLKGKESQKMVYFIISAILLAFSIYTYNIARLFTPILLLSLILIYWKKGNSISARTAIYSLGTFAIILIPFIYGAIAKGGADSTLGTLIFSSAKIQAPLQEFRSYFTEISPLMSKLLFNYYFMTFWLYINNVVSHFSVSYYFVNGDILGSSTSGNVGQWYIFELPLIVLGGILFFKSKTKESLLILLWVVELILVSSITRDPPQGTRTFFLLFPISLLSSIGLVAAIGYFSKLKQQKTKYAISLFASAICLYYVIYFLASYFVRFPIFYAKYWNTADREVGKFIKENGSKYKTVVIDRDSSINYSIILAELLYPPEKFIKEAVWSPDDSEGFSYPTKFSNIEIRPIDWEKDIIMKNQLLITSPDGKKADTGILKTITYPKRPVVFNKGQEIMRYPIEEPAYLIIETNR